MAAHYQQAVPCAQLRHGGRREHLGYFATEAGSARLSARFLVEDGATRPQPPSGAALGAAEQRKKPAATPEHSVVEAEAVSDDDDHHPRPLLAAAGAVVASPRCDGGCAPSWSRATSSSAARTTDGRK